MNRISLYSESTMPSTRLLLRSLYNGVLLVCYRLGPSWAGLNLSGHHLTIHNSLLLSDKSSENNYMNIEHLESCDQFFHFNAYITKSRQNMGSPIANSTQKLTFEFYKVHTN